MGQQKRTYGKEFKLEAIRLYEASGKSMREIEEELGISGGLLNKWRAGHRANGHQAFVGKGHPSEVDEEVRRLRRENESLRQERDVLKKALVVFSRDGH
jgi:transposase